MKRIFTVVSTIALACSISVSAFADWEADTELNITKYKKPNGEYATSEWLDIDGKQYYFCTTGELATGWVKSGDDWYYCESTGELRYKDLKTDVFTFKIDEKTGICSNFAENKTPSEQAGWSITNVGELDDLITEIAHGHIVQYNGQWWTTPDAFWIGRNPEVIYFHDIAPETKPVDRFALSTMTFETPESKDESLTGLWW